MGMEMSSVYVWFQGMRSGGTDVRGQGGSGAVPEFRWSTTADGRTKVIAWFTAFGDGEEEGRCAIMGKGDGLGLGLELPRLGILTIILIFINTIHQAFTFSLMFDHPLPLNGCDVMCLFCKYFEVIGFTVWLSGWVHARY